MLVAHVLVALSRTALGTAERTKIQTWKWADFKER